MYTDVCIHMAVAACKCMLSSRTLRLRTISCSSSWRPWQTTITVVSTWWHVKWAVQFVDILSDDRTDTV